MTDDDTNVSDAWSVTRYTDGTGDVAKERLELTNDKTGVAISSKEMPNGAKLALRQPADLPGGYDEVHSQSLDGFGAAKKEAERRAAQYDREGTWYVDGSPVLSAHTNDVRHPTLADFFHDMNEHGGAEYKKVGDPFVIELDSQPAGWRVLVWQAVEYPDDYDRHSERVEVGYAPAGGKPGNRYAWDAVGSREFDDRHDAKAEFVRLGNVEKVREYIDANPYDGPRRPYLERLGKID